MEIEETQTFEQRAKAAMPGGVNSYARKLSPRIDLTRGDGSKVYDTEGREYVDYLNAWGAVVHGHCDERVNAAVTEALETADLFGAGATEHEVELAEMVNQRVPCADKTHFGVSGTEVVSHALRLARSVTGRRKIIKFQGHYHGWYDPIAMNQISDEDDIGTRDPLTDGVLPEAMDETIVLEFNDREAVRSAIEENEDEIAAIVLEPVAHNMGCVVPDDGYLEFLRDVTDKHGIVLIFDEIITGFRHGSGGVQEREGVTPDLATMGKSVANGYPLSLLCGKSEYMNQFETAGGDTLFGGTYNGHVGAVAAAKETIRLLEDSGHDRLFDVCDQLSSGIEDLIQDFALDAGVKRYGSVFLTYFTDPPYGSYRDVVQHDTEAYEQYRRAMIEEGVLMVPHDVRRNYITTSHTDEDVEQTLEAAKVALEQVADE